MTISIYSDFRAVYMQGRVAQRQGHSLKDDGNPYADNAVLAFAWQEGYETEKIQSQLGDRPSNGLQAQQGVL